MTKESSSSFCVRNQNFNTRFQSLETLHRFTIALPGLSHTSCLANRSMLPRNHLPGFNDGAFSSGVRVDVTVLPDVSIPAGEGVGHPAVHTAWECP